jgi:capsular polysaccharide biosynthesis protein
VTPPLSIFILAAFAAGIALGGGLAAAAELLDPAIKSAVGLASAAGLPLIAVLDRLEA